MDKVTILMATYNGEKYIKELLDSLLNQTYVHWELIIRDDCSSDNTIRILSDYADSDSRISFFPGNERYGAAGNFAWLTQRDIDSDYVMFCDQDDVWLPDKIEKTLKAMYAQEEQFGKNTCQLVFCEKQLVDERLKAIELSPAKKHRDLSFRGILIINPIYGCTMMINRCLLEAAGAIPAYVQTHDYYYALYASAFGKIKRIDEPLILYRQHAGNVTGGAGNFGFANKIRRAGAVNRKLHETIRQNYLFCRGIQASGNQDAQNYVHMIESNRCARVIRAVHSKHHMDSFLPSLRLYYALFTFKKDDII